MNRMISVDLLLLFLTCCAAMAFVRLLEILLQIAWDHAARTIARVRLARLRRRQKVSADLKETDPRIMPLLHTLTASKAFASTSDKMLAQTYEYRVMGMKFDREEEELIEEIFDRWQRAAGLNGSDSDDEPYPEPGRTILDGWFKNLTLKPETAASYAQVLCDRCDTWLYLDQNDELPLELKLKHFRQECDLPF